MFVEKSKKTTLLSISSIVLVAMLCFGMAAVMYSDDSDANGSAVSVNFKYLDSGEYAQYSEIPTINSSEGSTITLPTVTKAGYMFAGWQVIWISGYTDVITTSTYTISENFTTEHGGTEPINNLNFCSTWTEIDSATYGSATNVNIAPGYNWTYTPTYPSDLSVTTSIFYSDDGIATMNGSTVVVTIPTDAVVGSVYNVIIKASTTQPPQTAYQYVTFTVISGLNVPAEQTISDIVLGNTVSFTPNATSSMGDVTWEVKSGTTLPAGLSLNNGIVSGTPTTVGTNTVSLTASCTGQTADLVVTFTVYSKIVGGDAQTITSIGGSSVSSTAISNAADVGVTWAITNGEIPDGFSLNATTGVISGSSSAFNNVTLTLTGSSTNGPSQTATKTVTIHSEPTLVLTAGSNILTYINNATGVSSTTTFTASTSEITWTVSGYTGTGVTIANGVVTATNPSVATSENVTLTIRGQTAYGQDVSKTITLFVEAKLTISPTTDTIYAISGKAATTENAFTIAGGSENDITVTNKDAAITDASVTGNKLSITSSTITSGTTSPHHATITVTSDAGQTAECVVTVYVYNVLSFTNGPSVGVIAYEVTPSQ